MKKFSREFLHSKVFRIAMLACLAVSMMVCTAFAAEGDPASSATATITAAFQTGFQQMVSDALGLIAIIVPIALGLAGTIFLVKKAMGWFKGMTKG